MSKYVFKPYSALFPQLFSQEKKRIALQLPSHARIEHIGSTAVSGLGGKGIIDIIVIVPKADMEEIKSFLEQLGYTFRPSFSTPERFYFIIDLPDPEEGTRRYHLHMTDEAGNEWKSLVGFRDFLRSHPKELEEYAALKAEAASRANQDGETYRKIKEPMFQKFYTYLTTCKE